MSEPTSPTYEQLAAYLAYIIELANVGGLVGPDQLRPLAQEVRLASVKGLLFARQSDILDSDNVEQFPYFYELLNGVAVEVETVAGADPDEKVRALAVHAVTLGVAAQIELAAYPEQQLGDDNRARQLQQRYEAALARLGALTPAGTDGTVTTVAAPRGRFPDARPYPDPVEQPCSPYRGVRW